ncbi:MAG TPA: SMC family ATPase [Trebonia sp.]|nr:SMC family ATPase [Trebonia sp.]
MRPIRLDMHGFASFREPTSVDFTDADFFALVGPTGSGKSTVIDAMTFALYGTVPRWDDKRVVALGLAPTVTRGTVKLVFEVGRERYVVARELRRAASGASDKVTQRAASLERVLSPQSVAEPGEPTTPMAKDLAGVTEAVEKLLGLTYEDFIQCVVLPQGQFADFLHAKPKDRQDILLRLLGIEHYKQMMVQANQRASEARQRAATLADSLLTYADATDEAHALAQARESDLAGLGERVASVLPQIHREQQQLATAEATVRRLRDEQAALSALRVPAGVPALAGDLARGQASLHRLEEAERTAEKDEASRRQALAAGPDRAPLLLVRERRDERNRNQARLPDLEASATQRAAAAIAASKAVDETAAAADGLRDQRDEARQVAGEAADRVRRLTAEHDRLRVVSVPAGVTALDERHRAAAQAVDQAARGLAGAERAEATARAARGSAVPEAPLAQAFRDLHDLRGLLAERGDAEAAAGAARIAQGAARDDLAAAAAAHRQRQADLEAAQHAHLLAGLRPQLAVGEACPLCEHPVAVLPAVAAAPELDEARSHLHACERDLARAQRAADAATSSSAKAGAALDALRARNASLATALAAALDGRLSGARLPAVRSAVAAGEVTEVIDDASLARALADVSALMAERAELERAAEQAAAVAAARRSRHRDAQQAADQATADVAAAQARLRAARDPLVELGAPRADEANLAHGWAALAQWARQQADSRAAELAQARQAAEEATGQHHRLAAAFDDAERSLNRMRARARAASGDDERARAELSHVTGRIAELDGQLASAPDEVAVARQLALRDQLEKDAADAEQALRAARASRTGQQTALAALGRSQEAARRELSAARDPVVALGAPAVGLGDEPSLLDDWTALVTWASAQAAARAADSGDAAVAVATARASLERLAGQLGADLADAGLTVPRAAGSAADALSAVASGASSAVAEALADARAATRRIAERRAEAAGLAQRQGAAQEEQRVAKLLGDLLQANRFQRWLVSAAVDDLVTEASATLAALSAGQFDFHYDDGEFYVIDHADADARRSVRTLSGGETFQASLALALALSTQISALTPAGAARLDSIFLDEGFGTLDPETLDTVASTLETLAQGQRMVGVVTHVQALAERVPVRFRVSRSPLSSTITREGLTAAEHGEVVA